MRYRMQCLTPLLIGDGSSLSPIDYMVWKNQVNVLDQKRIFRLLAKGPRLENYLTQIKRAEKLDFASWGGFAQNFAGRRIPFEHPAYAAQWERLRAEHCHIPLFASGTKGPFLPGSALRGALRTAVVASRANQKALANLERAMKEEGPLRHPAEAMEHQVLGRSGHDPFKTIAVSDSAPVDHSAFRIFLIRTAVLVDRKSGPAKSYALAWKHATHGSIDGRRVEEATPILAEMATPGTIFEGDWIERSFYQLKETAQSLRWRDPLSWKNVFQAANLYAGKLLASHGKFAQSAGLPLLDRTLDELGQRLAAAQERGNACLLSVGWGGGLLGKTAFPDTEDEAYRSVLGAVPYYARAIKSGMPFPKTRRIVFLDNQPAALPGWVWLEMA
ncbi:MAG: type III-A CRISPR-associated RAMP protein Csm5 [Acidobacteriia bacterium]|nr:type III-A CRISPR-associated RAMP protein Csm5 [Terriglobia bacterium]